MARNKLVNKVMSFIGLDEPVDEFAFDEVDQQPREQGSSYYGNTVPVPSQEEPSTDFFTSEKKIGKVVTHPSLMGEQQARHRTMICHMRDFNECQKVIDDLLEGRSVLLNLEEMDPPTSQRIIDMLSGAAYAIQATIKKTAQSSYILAPYGVEVINMDEQPRHNAAANYFTSRR